MAEVLRRRKAPAPLVEIRASFGEQLRNDSVALKLPETHTVYQLKRKVLLLTQDDVVEPEELEVTVKHDHSDFVLEDDTIIRDIPYDSDGFCAVLIHRRRPVKRQSCQRSREAAQVPLQERVQRVSTEFEGKFKSAVQFRLDDFLCELN